MRWITILMLLIASLFLLLDRVRVLRQFAFKYTDQDQTLLWYQSVEASHGRFHEPCFYGQAYSPAIEAWCASPLVRAGVRPHIALPLTTAFFAVIPYFVIAGFSFAYGYRWAAVAVLLIPLALPIEYSIVTSMSRGFVTGVFFAAPAAMLWISPSGKRWRFVVAGFLAALAITANINAGILLLFVGIFALLTHGRTRSFWISSVAGALLAAPMPLLIWNFYRIHPGYIVHTSPSLDFSISKLIDGIQKSDLFFGHFAIWRLSSWSIIAALVVAATILAVLGQSKAAIATGVGLLFTLLTLGLEKVHDCGVLQDLFFSGSRMYLSVPLMAAICIGWLERGITCCHWFSPRIVVALRTVFIVGLCTLSLCRDTTLLRDGRSALQDGPIYSISVDHLARVADAITPLAKSSGTDLLLILDYRAAALNYAAPILTNGAYETVLPQRERRTWRLQEEETRRRQTIVVYTGKSPALDDSVKVRNDDGTLSERWPAAAAIQSNGSSALEMTNQLGLPIRNY